VPEFGGWSAHIVYKKQIEKIEINKNRFMSIDLGINNFVTTLKSNGEGIIYNGKGIKSSNQFYNKVKARLTSNKAKSKCKKEKEAIKNQLYRISEDRKGYIKTKMATIAHAIVEDCVINKIGNIVVGLNEGWKQECNMGKKTNQNFVSIPHSKFIEVLTYIAKMKGIKVSKVNESHTSKCDSMAGEEITHQETYLGKRIKRGLFLSSVGQVINADINGAFNILRRFLDVSGKSIGYQRKICNEILCSGCLQRPRIVSL